MGNLLSLSEMSRHRSTRPRSSADKSPAMHPRELLPCAQLHRAAEKKILQLDQSVICQTCLRNSANE